MTPTQVQVMALTERYRSRHSGWNVKHFHFHSWYKREDGSAFDPWIGCSLDDILFER